jgi:hypothetical protein
LVTDLESWRSGAAPGDHAEYHRGSLVADRLKDPACDKIAADAWRLAERGRVCLVQKKIRDGVYSYIAVASDLKPWPVRT